MVYEALQCSMCWQPPAFALQCPSCHSLICHQCQPVNSHCQVCFKKSKEHVKHTEIKDKLLQKLLDRLIVFKHQCTDDMKPFYLSQSEMTRHRDFDECPSKLYRCGCQENERDFTFTLSQLKAHLKTECPLVKIPC